MSRTASRYVRRRAGRTGFTLTEVAVSVAIVAGLTAAVAVGVNAVSSEATGDGERYASSKDSMVAVQTETSNRLGLGDLSYGGPLTFSVALSGQLSVAPSTSIPTPTFSVEGTLPDGVTFDAATGRFSGPDAWNFEAVQIAAGEYHTCAVTASGGAKCWGSNGFGQLGDGTTTNSSTPVDVSGLTSGVASISAGGQHTCAVTTTGGAKCWGRNITGQLGDGTTTNSAPPVDVSGLTSGVTSISAGSIHTCAVTTAGGAKCWGSNSSGQLGDGTTTQRETPVDVSGLTSGVASISTGGSHTCAVTTAGGAKCWGSNSFGRLGDGTTTQRETPVDVSGLTSGVASISTGGSHTCAVTTAGGAKCWGWNSGGRLGDGTQTQRTSPVDVSGLTSGVASIDAGGSHTCAVTAAGGAKCWGVNNTMGGNGMLGDGTTTNRTSPVDVSGLTSGVASISAGFYHTCAVTASGGAKCWGTNGYGPLGDGTTTNSSVPVDVSGITGNPGWPATVTVSATDGTSTATAQVTLQKQ